MAPVPQFSIKVGEVTSAKAKRREEAGEREKREKSGFELATEMSEPGCGYGVAECRGPI